MSFGIGWGLPRFKFWNKKKKKNQKKKKKKTKKKKPKKKKKKKTVKLALSLETFWIFWYEISMNISIDVS